MFLRTIVRDCLYVNWALPKTSLPRLPEPLTYECHQSESGERAMVSALLFRQTEVQLAPVPLVRLAYPQFNLRFYVTDGEGVPSVVFRSLMVPAWVVPLARLAGQRGLHSASLRYPRIGGGSEDEGWRWRVCAGGRFEVVARTGAQRVETGPNLGSWQATCDYFRRRDRGYLIGRDGLSRVETSHERTTLWPAVVEIGEHDLLQRALGTKEAWPPVHSAWVCPEMPLRFELLKAGQRLMAPRVPAPG